MTFDSIPRNSPWLEVDSAVDRWLRLHPELINTHGLTNLPAGYPIIVPGEVRQRDSTASSIPSSTSLQSERPTLIMEVPEVLRPVLQCEHIELVGPPHHQDVLWRAGYAQALVFTNPQRSATTEPQQPRKAYWSEPIRNWSDKDLKDAIAKLSERARVDDRLDYDRQLAHRESEVRAVRAKLQRWGLFMDTVTQPASTQLAISPRAFHQRLRDADLSYQANTVAEVFAALDTHQLIVLSGPPGHGKTRIVTELGKLPGVKLTVVRVRPSWHDPADLLGYQNPLASGEGNRPHITNFTKALLMAEANPEQLHLILLDEFNLAPVEHYMADFLSLIENRSRAEYPNDEASSVLLGYEWPKALQPAGGPEAAPTTDDEHFRAVIESLLAERNLGGSKVTLPPNVRLIGTVNIDATVELLSPRVVDRSVVVQIGGENRPADLPDLTLSDAPLSLRPLADLPSWNSDLQALTTLRDDVEARINKVKLGLEGLGWGVRLSPRRNKQAALLADALAKVIAEDTPARGAVIADAIVRMLVLPRFMDIDRDRAHGALRELKSKLNEAQCRFSEAELDALQARPHVTLSYWVY